VIGGAVTTSLMLPLSGDLFDPPAEAIVDNSLICAVAHESGSGTFETSTNVRYAAAFVGKPDIERTSQKGRLWPERSSEAFIGPAYRP